MEQKLVSVKHTRSSTARECDLCSFLPRRGTPARSLRVPNTGLRIDFNRWPNKYLSNLTWLHTRRSILQIETVSEDRFHSRAQLALWWYHRLPASHFHGNAETDLQVYFQTSTRLLSLFSLCFHLKYERTRRDIFLLQIIIRNTFVDFYMISHIINHLLNNIINNIG